MNLEKMIETNPVKAAAKMAKPVEKALNPEEAKAKMQVINEQIVELENQKSRLLPFEENGINELDNKINKLKDDLSSLSVALCPAPATLPIFDLSCLRWRDEDGFPRLVPFKINDSKFTIGTYVTRRQYSYGSTRTNKVEPSMHNDITNQYKDVFEALKNYKAEDIDEQRAKVQAHNRKVRAEIKKEEKKLKPNYNKLSTLRNSIKNLPRKNKAETVKITAKFDGIIPNHVRDMMAGAMEVFQDLYIIAEVPEWNVTREKAKVIPAPIRRGDPLLVGYDGKHYRLIAEFDTTTVEQVAADRSRGKKSN